MRKLSLLEVRSGGRHSTVRKKGVRDDSILRRLTLPYVRTIFFLFGKFYGNETKGVVKRVSLRDQVRVKGLIRDLLQFETFLPYPSPSEMTTGTQGTLCHWTSPVDGQEGGLTCPGGSSRTRRRDSGK